MTDLNPSQMLAESRIEESSRRIRYQHEYALQGFKTLTLINGGAIIALLTYAGHVSAPGVAKQLSHAFLAYALGLTLSVVAYLFSYLSQAELMNADIKEAYKILGLEYDPKMESHERRGMRWVRGAIALCLTSLFAFVAGSWLAMKALS